MKVLSDIDVSGKRVFVRAGIDVDVKELQGGGSVRLEGLKPTVDYLISHKASKIILAGKIGRPNGKVDPALSTKNLVEPLAKILGQKIIFSSLSGNSSTSDESQPKAGRPLDEEPTSEVSFAAATVNREPDFAKASLDKPTTDNRIVLLENLHFWPGELEPSMGFAKELASLADIYINEAFPSCHRNEASISLLPTLLPHAAGLKLEEEVKVLGRLLKNAKKPFVAIIGGAKIETKIPVIENIAKVADQVFVGGYLPIEIEKKGLRFGQNVMVATLTKNNKDINNSSIVQTTELIKNARTIVWNGNLGLTEEGFDQGTVSIAAAIIEASGPPATPEQSFGGQGAHSVVGGGDTTQFLASRGLLSGFSFVSTGGGAMLAFLAGKELPGLKALE